MIFNQFYPQALPRIKSPMFFQKSEPSNATSSKSEQPTAEQLAKLGITVRDFAYESTLPPVAPVYFLPKQIQPDPRVTRPEQGHPLPLFRQLSVNASDTDGKPAPAGRVTRQRGFSDLRDYGPYCIDIPDSQESGSQTSLAYSDEYVKTPVVTPNGSLQWQDADIGDIPTGTQIEIRPLSRAATEQGSPSQATIVGSSPLSSVHSSFRISPSPKARSLSPKHRARVRRRKDLMPAPSGSRYCLRQRPGKAASTVSGNTRTSAGQKKRIRLRQLA